MKPGSLSICRVSVLASGPGWTTSCASAPQGQSTRHCGHPSRLVHPRIAQRSQWLHINLSLMRDIREKMVFYYRSGAGDLHPMHNERPTT